MMEQVVRQFARYHRYTLGTDLRQQAMAILRLVHKAWRDKAGQSKHLKSLVWAIDDFKLTLQIAKELQAFTSFAQFEHVAQLVCTLGKQCGGWLKTVVNAGQNSQGPHSKESGSSRSDPND